MYDCLNQQCSNHLKFDTFVSEYQWVSSNQNARLVLEYDLTGKGQNVSSQGDTIEFGDLWVYFNQTAYYVPAGCNGCGDGSCFCNSTNQVGCHMVDSTQGNKASIQLQFDRFPNGYSLVNDPAIGINSASAFGFSFALIFLILLSLF